MKKDYTELRKRILGKYGSLGAFAKKMGMTSSTLSKKLAGASEWARIEIENAAILLSLTADEVWQIFFA